MFFKTFQHLLPSGAAWRTTTTKTLRKFFEGLSGLPEAARAYIDLVFYDAFPDTTRELAAWEAEFGLEPNADEATRRLALAAEWKATGGQSPRYIEDVLQTAGFDLYVHEWWLSGPPYAWRDPRDYTEVPLIGSVQCTGVAFIADQPQCSPPGADGAGDSYNQPQCNRFLVNDPHYFANKNLTNVAPQPISSDPLTWRFFLYIGGETFPDIASVPVTRKAEFERLIQKIKPAQQWIVTLIDYFGEGDDLLTEGGDPILAESGSELLTE